MTKNPGRRPVREDDKLVRKGAMQKLFSERGHEFITTFTEKGQLKNCGISLTKIAEAIDQLPAEPNWEERWKALKVKIKKIYANTHSTEALYVLEGVQKKMKKLEEEP